MCTRTLESLCQELVEQGLLKQANTVGIQDYLGKKRFCYASELLLSEVFRGCDLIAMNVFTHYRTFTTEHFVTIKVSRNCLAVMCCPLLVSNCQNNMITMRLNMSSLQSGYQI